MMNLDKMRAVAARRSNHEDTEMPAAIDSVPADRIVDLDVREDLRKGIEPFSRIMQEQARVPAGGVLRLRAIFDPVPLYMVLGKQGFSHWTERLADDDWQVWFYRGDADSKPAAAAPAMPATPGMTDLGDVAVLDVRGLEPPEPMTRTLEALDQLPSGKALLQINARVPQMLLPLLLERGFEYVLVSEQPNEVRGLIRPITANQQDDA